VYRSNRHIYAQLIDDVQAATLVAASDAEVKGASPTVRAKAVGENRPDLRFGARESRRRARASTSSLAVVTALPHQCPHSSCC